MFAKNNQISGRQMMRLLLFELLGYSALLAPAVLAKTAGRDGIFSIGIGIAAGFFYLWLLKPLSSRMQGSYCDCLVHTCGRMGGNLIKAGYFVYFLLLAARVAAVFAELVVKELLEKQFGLILFLIMVLVYYGVSGGMEGRARIYEILFWIVLIPLFLMMLSALPAVDTDYWIPVLIGSPVTIFRGGYQVFLCVSILFLVPFFAEYVSGRGQVYRCAKKALTWTGVILGVLYLLLLGMFGADALATMDYPVVTMMSRIQMTGGFLKRTDALMFGIWFFTLYALLNSLVFFAGRLWPLKKRGTRVWLLAETVVVYLLANAFYHSEGFKMLYEKFFYYVGTPFVVLIPLLVCFLLSGCGSTTELENREFPTLLTISEESDFTGEWLNGLQEGAKKIDYNHLKVILVAREFLENEEAMDKMLALLKEDKNVPLNAYVVTMDTLKELKEAEADLEKPLGDYLEDLLEHGDTVKKETYPTIGMLYQEAQNRKETLFIPTVSLVEEKPEITSYEVYKRGAAIGQVESDVALLSFFVNNQMEEYVLQLGVNNYVRLSNPKNEIYFRENRAESGLLRKQVVVDLSCDGKILQQTYGSDRKATEEWLSTQMKEYMTAKAAKALEAGVDITNSLKKLGTDREWYRYYSQSPDFYEGDIQIIFETDIKWID